MAHDESQGGVKWTGSPVHWSTNPCGDVAKNVTLQYIYIVTSRLSLPVPGLTYRGRSCKCCSGFGFAKANRGLEPVVQAGGILWFRVLIVYGTSVDGGNDWCIKLVVNGKRLTTFI